MRSLWRSSPRHAPGTRFVGGWGVPEYPSCEAIEGGVSFHARSVHVCSVRHHDTGCPFVGRFDGKRFPLEELLRVRQEIRDRNARAGHPACRGCAYLTRKAWPRSSHPIHVVAIGNSHSCNLACSYCHLQQPDFPGFGAGFKPYRLTPTLRALIDDGLLSPSATIEWGGAEPTLSEEFDELLELLLAHGTYNIVHTNATRLPDAFRRTASPERIHVVCSIDAGLRETYRRVKGRDRLERVMANLAECAALGVRLTLKYIVIPDNCADADLEAFVERVGGLGAGLQTDTDAFCPAPAPEVVRALGRLEHLARQKGVTASHSLAGHFFAPGRSGPERVEAALRGEQSGGSPVSPEGARSAPRVASVKSSGPEGGMEYRSLGSSGLWVSAVGFGTCQLCLVPQQQAIDTLLRGFELGVNIVHTA